MGAVQGPWFNGYNTQAHTISPQSSSCPGLKSHVVPVWLKVQLLDQPFDPFPFYEKDKQLLVVTQGARTDWCARIVMAVGQTQARARIYMTMTATRADTHVIFLMDVLLPTVITLLMNLFELWMKARTKGGGEDTVEGKHCMSTLFTHD